MMSKSLKQFYLIKVIGLAALTLTVGLAGCSTNKEKMFPHDDTTMKDIWQQGAGSASQQSLLDARAQLRRPISNDTVINYGEFTRNAANEINSQFQRLPNPDLVMFVFPHLSGMEGVPVPGYSTIFPLYNKVQYAMPGERVEDY